MKDLVKYMVESENEQPINESIITAGATIWALGKIIGLAATGILITVKIVNVIIEGNKKKKEYAEEIDFIDNILSKYPELKDEEKCPTWVKLLNAQDDRQIQFLLSRSYAFINELNEEAKAVLDSSDYIRWEKINNNKNF